MENFPPSIGVLDSGIGGLSVLREIHKLLPHHPTIYFADQFHLPYGPRPVKELHHFTDEITRDLLKRGCRVIVLACNTASAASLYYLRAKYPDVPFVGMEPAIKPAIAATQTGVVGMLSTRTTAEGELYKHLLERHATDVRVITQVAPDLVQVAEQQLQDTDEGRAIVRRCLEPLIQAGADQIVLGCTHFPFLSDAIQEIAGHHVHLVDPSPAIARQVKRVWPEHIAVLPATSVYITSGDATLFQQSLRRLLGTDTTVESALWTPDNRLCA